MRNFIGRLKLKTKVAIGTGIILATGLASMLIIYVGLAEVRRALERLADINEPIHTAIHEMEININRPSSR